MIETVKFLLDFFTLYLLKYLTSSGGINNLSGAGHLIRVIKRKSRYTDLRFFCAKYLK